MFSFLGILYLRDRVCFSFCIGSFAIWHSLSFGVGRTEAFQECKILHWVVKHGISHVLLHYPSSTLAAARQDAWEGRDPGSVRVILSNARWKRRLVRFLELSEVGRRVVNGTDEDEARAERMDQRIVWETEEREEPEG